MQELAIVRGFIRRVRSQMLRRRALEWSVIAAAVSLVWTLGVLVISPLLPTGRVWGALLLVSLASLVAVAGWQVLLRSMVGSRDERAMARAIERAEPELRNDLVTSLQFGQSTSADEVSSGMVRAHLRHTARLTERFRHRQNLFHHRDLGTAGRLAAIAASVALLVALAFPTTLERSAMLLFGIDLSEPSVDQSVAETAAAMPKTSLVHDLDLELRYPAYTELRAQSRRNTSGRINPLRGTEIHFEGRLAIPAESASVILEADDGTEIERAAEVRGDRVVGSFTALSAGTWRFRLMSEGELFDNDVRKEITLVDDERPLVTIDDPDGAIEVTATEVVKLHISAVDDFGLSEIAIRHSFQGAEETEERLIVASVDHQASWSGEYLLDLSQLELEPSDVLIVVAEAVDNDEVLRPKSADSQPITLRVASPEDRHESVLRDEEELVGKLVELLADYLENPVLSDEPGQINDRGAQPRLPASDDRVALVGSVAELGQKRAVVLEAMNGVVERMATDPLMLTRDYELVRSLYEKLYNAHRDADQAISRLRMISRGSSVSPANLVSFARTHRITQVRETERTIITLEELIISQWLDAAQMTVNRIRELKARLQELLKQYKESQDPALKAEIMKEVSRLEAALKELMERLGRQMQHVPPEHLNADARGGESAESMANLAEKAESVRELLDKGDIEGALAALEAMDDELQKMLAITQAGSGGGGGASKMDQQASDLMDTLNDLAAEEAAVEKDTAEIRDAIRKRHAESLASELPAVMDDTEAALDAIREKVDGIKERAIDDRDRDALSELERTLDSADRLAELEDLEGLRTIIGRLDSNARGVRKSLSLSRARKSRTDPSRTDYTQSIDDAKEIETGALDLFKDIDDLLSTAPPEPTADQLSQLSELGERQQQIRDRTTELEAELDGAVEEFPQFEMLGPQLKDAQGFMDDASGSLESPRVADAVESERQALRSLRAMKEQLQKSMEKERQGKESTEKVVIPEEDEGPRAFHQEVMDAMKDPGLGEYVDENSLYYKSLVE